MLKTILLIIATLLIVACNKSSRWNVIQTVAEENINKIAASNRYDRQQLQSVLDSLITLDSRNTIHHQLDIYGTGKDWYTVDIYKVYDGDDKVMSGENSNPRFHTGSMKNWLLAHSKNIANAITKCSYNRDTYVGIHYMGEDGRVYFTPIINLSLPNPCICWGSIAGGYLPDIGWQ